MSPSRRNGSPAAFARRSGVAGAAVLALVGLSACGDAASPPEHPESQTLRDVARRSLEGSLLEANADTLLGRIGARISALPSGDSAQAFVARRLEAHGLDDVGTEPFELLAWDRREAALEIVAPTAEARDDLTILSLGHVGSFEIRAPLLDAGFGTAEEIAELGERVAGKVVLVDVGSPPGYGRGVHRTEKVTLATEAGAVGFIQVSDREGPLVPVGVATIGDYETRVPAVAADHATGGKLRAALAAAGDDVTVRLEVDNWMARAEARNVLGQIRGRTDEVVLVGAHLDSWDLAEGALDNGSGTLTTLDVARALAEHVRETGERPAWSTR
jgi:carboxypeptidase Q